jgi:phage tail-like protein
MPNSEPNPINTFNFSIEIKIDGVSPRVCDAAFSECDGLEMTMEVKTLREGGNNARQHRLTGPIAYGQLTLKRGVTSNFDLWDWFKQVMLNPRLRADANVVVLAPNGATKQMSFLLTRCVPVKLKAPGLNAASGNVAIEELQLAYETLTLQKPGGKT